jgi:hypothetical protein
MPVDTAKVEGRRTLHFNTPDDILADVERLNQGKVRALGNLSPGQILKHLTVPMLWSLDGAPIKAAWHMRLVAWIMKKRFLCNPMPAGFKLPENFAKQLIPGETSWEDGLQAIRTALARMKAEPQRHPSPILGELTREQWDQLNCRHCELHLSFLIPDATA